MCTANITSLRVTVLVFNTILTIFHLYGDSQVLLLEETGEPEENHQPAASHSQIISYNVVSGTL
jgi:hypothetical protein